MSNRPVRLQKRLLQFNAVPFAFGEIDDPEYSIALKGQSQTYTNNAHGAYLPTLGESGILEPSTFRATISFDFRKIACEEKIRYARFIKRQLLISGKLWAVQNGVELLWTNAIARDISEAQGDRAIRDMFTISVTFELPDGYWRMAKTTRTFLCEYCPNRYEDFDPNFCQDQYDYNGVCGASNSCAPCVVDLSSPVTEEACDWRPLCEFPLYNPRKVQQKSPNNPAVYIDKIIPSRYDMFGVQCSNQWYIDYSCQKEQDYFCYDDGWGRKFRIPTAEANTTYTFSYCSQTDLPTTQVKVRLVGKFENPEVIINGDSMKFSQNVDGILVFGFGPRAYTNLDVKDANPNQRNHNIQPWLSRTNTPPFQITAGRNCVTVKGAKFNENCFVYIETVDITW